jgi:hypothetical protein
MSSMTMPIPAISDHALTDLASGLKKSGSLMWTGTPIPKDLKELVETGVPVASNVKPLKDREQVFRDIDFLLDCGVVWVGIEIDSGQGTKIGDKEMGFACTPFSSREMREIRKRVPVPLACKGVLSGVDAKICMDEGADLIVVSNHGGHTLDYLPHPFQVMDEILEAVGGHVEIMVDGGFRRGSDVLKGLAMGARLVGLGRPILHGLAAGGVSGIEDLIKGITRELARLMTMTGVTDPGNVPRRILIEQ